MVQTLKRRQLYEGSAKILFDGPEEGTLIQHFKDEVSAFSGAKRGVITGKGVINSRISEYLMTKLEIIGIPTHFIKSLNMREQLIKKVDIIPITIVIRNIAAGSLAKRFKLEEGVVLPKPIIEYHLKSQHLQDPLINEDHIISFGWADLVELEEIRNLSIRINDFLAGLFLGVKIRLIDLKLEFGRLFSNESEQLILADEISPDCCRLWDLDNNESLDKDRFRKELKDIDKAYQEVAIRLRILNKNELIT